MKILKILFITLLYTSCLYGQDDFSVSPIPDSIWAKMQGKTFVDNPNIQRSDLRYLRVLHWDYDQQTHQGELVCNKLIADKLLSIFRELYRQHYPIQHIRLADEYDADDERQMRDNNTSCFCYRTVAGSKSLSYHARGLAVDINPLYNPYVRQRKDGTYFVQPATATPYINRSRAYRYKITKDDLCYRLFIQHGFTWGGSWKAYKDYQHFDYRPQNQ